MIHRPASSGLGLPAIGGRDDLSRPGSPRHYGIMIKDALRAAYDRSALQLIKAQDLGDHIAHVFGLDDQVRHGGM